LGDSRWRLAANSEHGIFRGIGLYSHWETRIRKGFNRLIDNRVGMTGTGRQYLALAGNSRHFTFYLIV
jgi:hypothetical protein